MDKNLRNRIWLLKSYRGTKQSDDCTYITLRVPLKTIRERIPISEYNYYNRDTDTTNLQLVVNYDQWFVGDRSSGKSLSHR
jgi:hypothetical protein